MASQPEIKALLLSIGNDVIESAQRNLRVSRMIGGKKRNRYNTGKLSANLDFKVKETAKTWTYSFFAKGPAKDYWSVIHYGRRKGAKMPPLAPIEQWMKQRGLRPRNKQGAFIKVADMDAWRKSVSWVIARKISKDGIEAVPFFKEAFVSVWDSRQGEIKETVDKIVKRTLQKVKI